MKKDCDISGFAAAAAAINMVSITASKEAKIVAHKLDKLFDILMRVPASSSSPYFTSSHILLAVLLHKNKLLFNVASLYINSIKNKSSSITSL